VKVSSQGISVDARLVVNPNMVFREEADDCALLFDPDSGSVKVFNPTASAIWKLLDGKRTLSEVIGVLREEFEDMDAKAEEQVLKLVEELYQVGAIGTMTELSKWTR
jgi:hypothetical protein